MANIDASIDTQLANCVAKNTRNSFFLFAGAGSGKTYSLVQILKRIKQDHGANFVHEQRKVAVITYTNAATDEIKSRIDYSPLFHISTIHSFLWDVIQPYQDEIKKLYLSYLDADISSLSTKLETTKNKTTKSYSKNIEKLEKLKEARKAKGKITQFVYNPNGDNLKLNSLNHSDVIKIGNDMIIQYKLLRRIISQQFPFMLIDESQDTNKNLVDAFFLIQHDFSKSFVLGLIGDLKQRIYLDGKENMRRSIPEDWAKPVKQMNYRCDKRIIELANKIAEGIDGSTQVARDGADEGCVHLFLADCHSDKASVERQVYVQMQHITSDDDWNFTANNVKVLTLEHRMAASRLGFEHFHDIMSNVHKYQMSYLQGTIPEMSMFSNGLFPLLKGIKENKWQEILELLKATSPLLEAIPDTDYVGRLHELRKKIEQVQKYDAITATARQYIEFVKDSNLFPITEIIAEALEADEGVDDEVILAWRKAMELPLEEFMLYDDYVNDRTVYATHQGVKGLEFSHVMVIIDDDGARGTLFNYERLFEVKPLSDRDEKNMAEGKETSIDRTLRLFYVTCTRAKHSLAIIMYTSDPEKAKQTAIDKGWFTDEEITILS